MRLAGLCLGFLLGLVACTIQDPRLAAPPEETAVAIAPATVIAATNTTPLMTMEPTPVPTATPSPTATAVLGDLAIDSRGVFLYPIPVIYSGDLVTFQVLPFVPDNVDAPDVAVGVSVNGRTIATGMLSGRNLGGQATGLFEWVWDTSGLVGDHEISVILDPDDQIQIGDENPGNNIATLSVTVLAAEEMPVTEVGATWITAESPCCHIHAISGTAAYRDLPQLRQTIETAVQQASNTLNTDLTQKLDIYLIDRVIGQGGYAANAMVISYLDRQYSGRGLYEVVVHETVHVLDRQFAPQRITFMAEGLAVWVTGGHYKPEDLTQRAAALIEIGQYVPLVQLIDNFYPVQHEVGYLQAAAFVQYLVERQGWQQFKAFYADLTANDAPTLAEAVDINLQIYYGRTLLEMEQDWLAALQQKPASKEDLLDLQTTLRYYDMMRLYQLAYDPAAYFLTAWLPYPEDVVDKGNPADFTRSPRDEINIVLEVMFQSVDGALRNADYQLANGLLDSIQRVLDNDGAFLDPLAQNYRQIVQKAAQLGFEAQQVTIFGETAVAIITAPQNNNLIHWELVQRGNEWVITANQ